MEDRLHLRPVLFLVLFHSLQAILVVKKSIVNAGRAPHALILTPENGREYHRIKERTICAIFVPNRFTS
jgi:hypothetical protein